MSFCKDCKHYVASKTDPVFVKNDVGRTVAIEPTGVVRHLCSKMPSADPINGAPALVDARWTRMYGQCGPDAKWFEPRPPEPQPPLTPKKTKAK